MATMATHEFVEAQSIENWFRQKAEELRLTAPSPDLITTLHVLKTYLPGRVKRYLGHLSNPEDTRQWLAIMLRCSCLIRLWRRGQDGQDIPITIATSFSPGMEDAKSDLRLISLPDFQTARQALGIQKHWHISIADFPFVVPGDSDLLDILYENLETSDAVGIIQL